MPANMEPDASAFLQTAAEMMNDAIFIVQSLPNVEMFSVERAILRLETLISALDALGSSTGVFSATDLQELHNNIEDVLLPLRNHAVSPPSAPTFKPNVFRTGRVGRPSYALDLDQVENLRWRGATWTDVAKYFNISKQTLYHHMAREGRPTTRPYSKISDYDLDEVVSSIVLQHPESGAVIISGHLAGRGLKLPLIRVKDSVRRVDPIGVLLRMRSTARRRVYKVKCSNSLWHQDGNEKLRPWGFYVHGCIDGFSRRIIYLHAASNKKAATVTNMFVKATQEFGLPSCVRGDYGAENNGIEKFMVTARGPQHRAYLRGKSLHNIKIERLWRDVRKDSLEMFRQVFIYLENLDLFNMEKRLHRMALYLVFQPRIQKSLDEMRIGWNNHPLRTEGHKTPDLMYELSRQQAINQGYWTGDPGDSLSDASDPLYGVDTQEFLTPPIHELEEDPDTVQEEIEAGIRLNTEEELNHARAAMGGFDFELDDANWGISVYVDLVFRLALAYPLEGSDALGGAFGNV